ncbi:MAG: hypothetical protein IPM98_15000 [Lewinellaceae bacterium]|nr:hypothetical protein [Lewinellaceae bacterium]
MYTLLFIEHGWTWFCIAFGAALLLSLMMERISAVLITKDRSLRKFMVIDLEFPSNPRDLPGIINGIYALPDPAKKQKVEQALKRILYLDFLFMPAVYGSIFLLCLLVAGKFPASSIGQKFFMVLAWAQLIPLVCDVVENGILLRCVRSDLKPMAPRLHQVFVGIVWVKWAVALFAGITAAMLASYFLIKGDYERASLFFLVVFLSEIGLFVLVRSYLNRKNK